MLTSRYPIAIDLGDGTDVGALQLAAHRGVPVVRAAARRTLEGGDDGAPSPDAVRSFVRDILRSGAFRGRAVALLPPSGIVRSYPLRLDLGREPAIEAVLVRHADQVLKLSAEEWILDYASVDRQTADGKEVSSVLLVAARKEDVALYVDLVRDAGGVLESVDSPACALVRTHALAAAGPGPTLLCHVGRSRTVLVVATPEHILAHRNAAWGTDRLKRKLAENLHLDEASPDTEFLLRKYPLRHPAEPSPPAGAADPGDDVGRTVGQLLAPVADELVHELHNLAGYIRSETPGIAMDGLAVYGRGARVNGLAPYLGRELELEARPVHPFGMLGTPQEPGADDGTYALALGLALRKVRWL